MREKRWVMIKEGVRDWAHPKFKELEPGQFMELEISPKYGKDYALWRSSLLFKGDDWRYANPLELLALQAEDE